MMWEKIDREKEDGQYCTRSRVFFARSLTKGRAMGGILVDADMVPMLLLLVVMMSTERGRTIKEETRGSL